jgi:hypothetical protein
MNMWPFNKKKQYIVLREEFETSKAAIADWYWFLVISLLVLAGFLSAFVACGSLWLLVPTALAAVGISRSAAAIDGHKNTVAQWMDQLRQKELERIARD